MNATSTSHSYLLVLEDSDEDFDTVMRAAREANLPYEIRRAATGDECVRSLTEPPQGCPERPLLVILDLNTPQGDGRQALQILRKDKRFKTLPIVILSSSGNPQDLDFCYGEGANAYHTKPVHYPAHLQTLRQIFDYWLEGVVLPAAP
ncbi:response regulator [Luteolibacter yonseiensis]|uniref:Response regulator n=1 Tax=Luteolibacter yonseiensis TaxID=1144680 RepID=A0A934RAX5_9BACT|nr:response regulator [Luteolibacter yonseiensis]MBK1818380.1 response regulator [Luteolibacter yonseiensis]